MSFIHNALNVAYKAGGSHKTIRNRKLTFRLLGQFLISIGINLRDLKGLNPGHVHKFIKSMLSSGRICARTAQSMLSDIRVTLRHAGFTKKADALKTAEFGVAGESRKGKRLPMPESKFTELLGNVNDKGGQSVFKLLWIFGMRAREGVRSEVDTLIRFEHQILEDGQVEIIAGTKGGRPRVTRVIDKDQALAVVREAIDIAAAQRGFLIDRPNLKKAMARFNYVAYRAGFRGEFCPHTIRYAYSQASMLTRIAKRYSLREAKQATAIDLGHGDGRGCFVWAVYGNGLPGKDKLVADERQYQRNLRRKPQTTGG